MLQRRQTALTRSRKIPTSLCMKTTYLYHWLAAAAVAASLPVTPARAMSGHGGGGFGGGGTHGSSGRGSSHQNGSRHDFGDHRFGDHHFATIISLIIVSLIAGSLTTTGPAFSFIITTVSSSVSTSLRLVFPIGGTPTTTTDTLMVTRPTITRLYTTTTGIGTVYPLQCKRSLPGAATTTGRLTERSAPAAARPFDLFKRRRDSR